MPGIRARTPRGHILKPQIPQHRKTGSEAPTCRNLSIYLSIYLENRHAEGVENRVSVRSGVGRGCCPLSVA
eukprot:scaffold25036_cov39-Phaeocystis_antarctica.AAC.2